jgi:protein-S-isoprenylcysteine O-methyltransferase Ste14
VQNVGLALLLAGIISTWFWLWPPDPAYRPAYVAMALATGALAVVSLFRPAPRGCDDRWPVYGLCLVSITYGLAYRFDATPGSPLPLVIWGRAALQLGASLTLLGLGRSYAMLPALRQVRTRFLYGYVRHPVYALYLLADLGTVALQPSPWNAAVAAAGAASMILRARLEERVLGRDPAYADYVRLVPWRFFPGVH